MTIESTVERADQNVPSRRWRGDGGFCRPRRRQPENPAGDQAVPESTASARPGTDLRPGTGQFRVAFQTPDPITDAGVTSALRGHPEIEVLPGIQDGDTDVLVVVADRLTHLHTAQLRRLAAATETQVVLVCDQSAGVDLMTIAACRIVVVLPRSAATPERILSSVLTAAGGGALVTPAMLRELLRQAETLFRNTTMPSPGTPTLTHREAAALRMTADGFNTAEIARHLKYSERTVKTILQGITHRLAARNRSQAVAYGIRSGLI